MIATRSTASVAMHAVRTLAILLACSLMYGTTPARLRAQTADRATVPLIVESDRPFVMVAFRKADGTTRMARMLLDTGGGGFLITEPLARDLGLTWGAPVREDGAEFGIVKTVPQVLVGELPLTLNAERTLVLIGRDNVLPPAAAVSADGMIPGHVLAQYHVIFDYPARTFTMAKPNVLTPQGTDLPMPVAKRSGFPRTEITVQGVTHGLLLDTGASFTMVSEVLLKAWGAQHGDWPRHQGAYGDAVRHGGQVLETLFLPGATWGAHAVPAFGVVSQREGTFERYMSNMMSAPIVGSLAGNVLKHFRVELDYPRQRLYLARGR